MSDAPPDSSKRSSRLGYVLGCAVLGPLVSYVGLNLFVVNTLTLIHESQVQLIVLEGGQPAAGVEVRPVSPSWKGSPSPLTATGALETRPATSSSADLDDPVITDQRGSLSYSRHVQDQGTWAIPRSGVTRNLSGQSFNLRRPGQPAVVVTLPPYQGQTKTFRVDLGPPK